MLLLCQILAAGLGWAGLGWAGCWLRNVWRCDDTCELLGWAGLGWAGWAGLQQLPSQHRDNTPDLGITRAALAGSRPRPALDFLPTYSHCASSAASKLCIVERSAWTRSVLICWCQHSVPRSAGSKLQTHDMMLQIFLQHGAAEVLWA